MSAILFAATRKRLQAVSAASAKTSPKTKIQLAEFAGGDGLLFGYAEDFFSQRWRKVYGRVIQGVWR